jgi:hypothetical protein
VTVKKRMAATGASRVGELWMDIEPGLRGARCLEQAAQTLVEALAHEFPESAVLTRAFCTVPFDALPPANRRFAQRMAEAAGAAHELRTVTPVLSLVGSFGVEPEWCDRRRSRGHVGIPLISEAFVHEIPMIAGLLSDLGIPLGDIDTNEGPTIEKTMARAAGLFHVEAAAEATDSHGRRVIPSREFVSRYGVESVFGIGGAYVGGQIFVLIVFCRDAVPRSAAEQFLALVALFKTKTARLVGQGRIFTGG